MTWTPKNHDLARERAELDERLAALLARTTHSQRKALSAIVEKFTADDEAELERWGEELNYTDAPEYLFDARRLPTLKALADLGLIEFTCRLTLCRPTPDGYMVETLLRSLKSEPTAR